MTSTDIPNGFVKKQGLTTPPYIGDNTLVDDPVALVDDPVALVGNQVTILEGIQPKVIVLVPRPRVKISR